MKKFGETIMVDALDYYDTMRTNISLMTVFYIIQYFKPKNILEMGFYEGQTFGIMLEAADANCELTALDLEFRMELYDRYYKNSKPTLDKKINLITTNSNNFCPAGQFDFINVDTGTPEELDTVRATDFKNAMNWLSKDGILMLDNYEECEKIFLSSILQEENLRIVPFLKDDQAMYFHHVDHDANHFLDSFIPEIFPNEFISRCNVNFYNHLITDIWARPFELQRHIDLFRMYCQFKSL